MKKIYFYFLFLFLFLPIFSQSLWEDRNPYSTRRSLKKGTILKLKIEEPIQITYEYENQSNQNIDINIVPDKNISSFLPPASTNQNKTKQFSNRVQVRSQLKMQIAVSLEDETENSVIVFRGTKFLGYENNLSRQKMSVRGRVHIDDVSTGRIIHSKDVADLQIVLEGIPVKTDINLSKNPPAQNPEAKQEGQTQQGQPLGKSFIGEEEKQKLLWNYIKNLLGDSLGP